MKPVLFSWRYTLAKPLQCAINPFVLKIKAAPFITSICAGNLSASSFSQYIRRDTLYLKAFETCLKKAASQTDNKALNELLFGIADSAKREANYYQKNLASNLQLISDPADKVCSLYIQHLNILSQQTDILPLLSATLPCLTMYKDLGNHFKKHYRAHSYPAIDNWVKHIIRFSEKEFNPKQNELLHLIDSQLNAENYFKYRKLLLKTCSQSASYELKFFLEFSDPDYNFQPIDKLSLYF